MVSFKNVLLRAFFKQKYFYATLHLKPLQQLSTFPVKTRRKGLFFQSSSKCPSPCQTLFQRLQSINASFLVLCSLWAGSSALGLHRAGDVWLFCSGEQFTAGQGKVGGFLTLVFH